MRGLVALLVVAFGVLVLVGSGIAILFELQGFGVPRDAEPRWGYIAFLGLALTLSLGVPIVIARLLRPKRLPGEPQPGQQGADEEIEKNSPRGV